MTMYILFEGVDGAGKTTLAEAVKDYLADRFDKDAALVKFPSSMNPVGRLIRDTLEKRYRSVSKEALLWLYAAEGVMQEPYILDLLNRGVTVLCDRHCLVSTFVYQQDIHPWSTIHNVTVGSFTFRVPDLIVLVDAPVDVAVERRTKTRGGEMFKSPDPAVVAAKQERYRAFARECRTPVIVVDGTAPLNKAVEDVVRAALTIGPF